MAILTSRIFASLLVCGALLISCVAISATTVSVIGAAHAQETDDDMGVKRDWPDRP